MHILHTNIESIVRGIISKLLHCLKNDLILGIYVILLGNVLHLYYLVYLKVQKERKAFVPAATMLIS